VVERPEASGASGVQITMYFVYIIQSKKTKKYYIGTSNDPNSRINEHNGGATTYTKSGIPWILIKIMPCKNKTDALKLEKFIKKQKSRKFIEKIINEGMNFYLFN